MNQDRTESHTYSVTETTHHVPAAYWLNKHFWFDEYDRVKANPEWFDDGAYTIIDVRFDRDQAPNESKWNPDGRSIWLTIRSNYELDFPRDHPHHAESQSECSTSESYLTKTETLLHDLGHKYATHEVIDARLHEDNDGVSVTVSERIREHNVPR